MQRLGKAFAAEFSDRIGRRKPRAHGPLRIVFVSLWVSEIGDNPIVGVLGKVSTMLLNDRSDASVTLVDDFAQLFRI